jgi:hypothetical protein
VLNSKPNLSLEQVKHSNEKGNCMKSTKAYALIAATLIFTTASQESLAGSGDTKAPQSAAQKKRAALKAIAAQKAAEKKAAASAAAYKAGGKPAKENALYQEHMAKQAAGATAAKEEVLTEEKAAQTKATQGGAKAKATGTGHHD